MELNRPIQYQKSLKTTTQLMDTLVVFPFYDNLVIFSEKKIKIDNDRIISIKLQTWGMEKLLFFFVL